MIWTAAISPSGASATMSAALSAIVFRDGGAGAPRLRFKIEIKIERV